MPQSDYPILGEPGPGIKQTRNYDSECIAVNKKINLGIRMFLSFHSFSLRINQFILKKELA